MSITDNSMLVNFSASIFNPSRTDNVVTGEVLTTHQAKREAGRFVKNIIPASAVADIKRLVGAARVYHTTNSLPWQDGGSRILPLRHFQAYKSKMDAFKIDFGHLVDEFVAHYPEYIELAKSELNDLFRDTDYPADPRGHFAFITFITPVPVGTDFRLEFEGAAEIRRNIDVTTTTIVEEGIMDILGRVKSKVAHLVDRLSTPDGILRDTIITNVQEVRDMLPIFNITGNTAMEAVHNELTHVCASSIALIRANPAYRANVLAEAKRVLSYMENLKACHVGQIIDDDEEV